MALKLVPWCPEFMKYDIRGVYRRPNGDLMPSLPITAHNKWQAKGFEFVTLGDAASLAQAAHVLRQHGHDPHSFICGRDGDGQQTCWNVNLYLAGEKDSQAAAEAKLAEQIEKYGVAAVEEMTGKPVPAHLKPKDVPDITITSEGNIVPNRKPGRPKRDEAVTA